MQMGGHPLKSAEAKDKDIYLAFNPAPDKVGKQLRRATRELREDKPERMDKGLILREWVTPASESKGNRSATTLLNTTPLLKVG